MEQSRRRFPSTQKRPPEKDPYFEVLMVQLVVCGLILAGSWGLLRQNPPFLPALKQYYQELVIGKKQLPSPTQIDLLGYPLWESVREKTTDLIERLTQSQKPHGTSQEPLTGAGGWFAVSEKEQLVPPNSCALSPILVNAAVDPPISGPVTSLYGYRLHPLTGKPDFHRGIDIAAPSGTAVRAALPGRVSEVGVSAIYGNYLILDHGKGLQTVYCHCETIEAVQGENMRQGELLATVGSTGISTGPHVHFEVCKDGIYYNPAWVLDGMDADGF